MAEPQNTPLNKFPPIAVGWPCFLHGGDYSPEQWLGDPQIIDADFRLARAAHVNTFSIGIFSWTALEPSEGHFEFGWLDNIMDRLAAQKMAAVLATPSGARPAWLSKKYPQVLRVNREGIRSKHDSRHNHCFTSPVYREKVAIIDAKLAERYHAHTALAVWHISNEYSGECHCNLCYAAFRDWLRKRYGTLDALNRAWWTAFWSHTFTDWDQIEPIDFSIDGMKLDWKRFVTYQTVDFMKHEIAAVRRFSKQTPVATNMMGMFEGIDYWKMAAELDVASWDSYPQFHDRDDTIKVAAAVAMAHDLNRSMKGGRPFMLMESCPSAPNWPPIGKLKKPGVLKLASLQAVAHGADTVQYFQWRKNRGSFEKFHGAVVDHVGHDQTRVFQEVADIGQTLEKLRDMIGSTVPAQAAIIHDWENRWSLEGAGGPRNDKKYMATCESHYRALWELGVPTDVINEDQPLDRYKLVIAPMLYMIRPGVAERFERFVKTGGTLVTTFLSGISNESDLCFLGGWPGPLRPLFGVWAEEIDVLYDDERRAIANSELGASYGLHGTYAADTFCDLIHAESAQVLATYSDGFYAGRPAVTVNLVEKGKAIYLAARGEQRMLGDLYRKLIADLKIERAIDADLPEGVSAQVRQGNDQRFVFLLNFSRRAQEIRLPTAGFLDAIGGEKMGEVVKLPADGVVVLRTAARR